MKKFVVALILLASLVGLGRWLSGIAAQPNAALGITPGPALAAPPAPAKVPTVPPAAMTAGSAPMAARSVARSATTPTTPTTSATRPAAAVTTTTVRATTTSTTRPTTTTSTAPPGQNPGQCSVAVDKTTVRVGDSITATFTSNRPGHRLSYNWSGRTARPTVTLDANGGYRETTVTQSGDKGAVGGVIDFGGDSRTAVSCPAAHYTVTS